MMEVIVLDFETTGLSPDEARIIEVGAVRVRDGRITERFSQLMDPGIGLPYFITSLTGITEEMLEGQPTPEQVMPRLKAFVEDLPIVAHNASFDRRFFFSEMERARIRAVNPFICTVMLARRILQSSPCNKLGSLARMLGIDYGQNAHRALADAEVTAHVWKYIYDQVADRTAIHRPDLNVFAAISKKPRQQTERVLERLRAAEQERKSRVIEIN
jgi:DNA polymerase-3 subunit epsilon